MNRNSIALAAAAVLSLHFLGCSVNGSGTLASDSHIATEKVDFSQLQVGDIFKISPSEDPALCYLPGVFGLTKQICGPYGLWRVRSQSGSNDASGGKSYWKTIESVEDGSCLALTLLNGKTVGLSTFCDQSDISQTLAYDSSLDALVTAIETNSPLANLEFYREKLGANRKDDLLLGAFTGSLDGVSERTYVHDARMPVINEIAIVESDIVPGTISAIELVHQDFTPGDSSQPIIEIMGFCKIGSSGHCKNTENTRVKINTGSQDSGNQKYEYFHDLQVKYINPDGTGPLVGVRAYHVNDTGDQDPAFEVNFIGGSLVPSSPIKSDFVSEEPGSKSVRSMALCNEGAMLGIDCNGRYCDNTALYCSKALAKSQEHWMGHLVSDNNDASRNIKTIAECKDGEAITGIQCESGSWCDNLKVRCAKIEGFDKNSADCSWTEAISEEQPNRDGVWYQPNEQYLIAGIKCLKGSYCDNKSLNVCKIGSLKQEGSPWTSLQSKSQLPAANPAVPLVGLSVRFTHPDMTRKTYSWEAKQQGFNRGYPKRSWTNEEVVSFGGYINGVGAIFAPFDESGFSGFANFQALAAGISTSEIIQSQSQGIGISGDTGNDEALSHLLSLQMFRFSSSFTDHLPIYDKSGTISSFPKLKTIELCATKANSAKHITGIVLKSDQGQIHHIGDTSHCNNDTGSQFVSHTLNAAISHVEWKPSLIQGRSLIGALKLHFEDETILEFNPNHPQPSCQRRGVYTRHGAGPVGPAICSTPEEAPWQAAFRKLDGYCINGFQGIAVNDQQIGGASVSKASLYVGDRPLIHFPSISEKIRSLGIAGLARLSPIYLAQKHCD